MEASENGRSAGKRLRAGGYSVLISVIFIALVVAVNLIAARLPNSVTKPDFSSVKLYDFDEKTKELAKGLSDDVTIYVWVEQGKEDPQLEEFLSRYAELSSRIVVKHIDPALSPAFREKYTEGSLSANSLVVESAKRFKIADFSEIFYSDYSGYSEEELYYYYLQTGAYPSATVYFDAENVVTGAVDYVTTEILPKFYTLTGHGESAISDSTAKLISDENIALESLNLISAEAVPGDAAGVLIVAPATDITEAELEKLLDYQENGGSVLLFTNYGGIHENISALAAANGMKAIDGIVFETAQKSVTGYLHWVIPDFADHEITEPLSGSGRVAGLFGAHGIAALDAYRDTLTVSPILVTSAGSYIKTQDPSEITSAEKASGDIDGPFWLGAVSAETVPNGVRKFAWYATEYILNEGTDLGANLNVALNTLGWVSGKEQSVTIRSIQMSSEVLIVDGASSTFWFVLLALILPCALIAAGFVIWYRRRRRT